MEGTRAWLTCRRLKYYKLADMLMGKATKEQLAECTRLLSPNLAHHQQLHGEIPLDQPLSILEDTAPSGTQLKLLADGMEKIVGVLGNVMSGLGENKH